MQKCMYRVAGKTCAHVGDSLVILLSLDITSNAYGVMVNFAKSVALRLELRRGPI